jgi:hypothetical protein
VHLHPREELGFIHTRLKLNIHRCLTRPAI